MRPAVLAIALAVLIPSAVAAVRWWPRPQPALADAAARLASCLKRQGVVMYGADWCSHCARQKQMFGAAFADVPYVECPQQPQRCLQAKIDGYPTWTFPSGRRLTGEQSLPALAEASGCSLTP